MEAPISMRNRLWMWLKYAVSVFRRFSTRYFGICHFFLRYCGIGYPPMSPSWGFRLKAFSLIIFLCYFKDIQSSYLNSNFALTLGYLDPALNNPSMVSNLEACLSNHMLNQVYKRFVTVFWQLIFLNMIVYLFHFTNQAFLGDRELKRRDSNNDYRNNKQYTRSLWTILL